MDPLSPRQEIFSLLSGKSEGSTVDSSTQQETQAKAEDVKTEPVKSPLSETDGTVSQEAQDSTEETSETQSEDTEVEVKESADTSSDKKSADAKEKNTPKTVPAAALYEERERRKELSTKLKEVEITVSELKKVVEIAKRELQDRDSRLHKAQSMLEEAGRKDRIVSDETEVELKKLKLDQELKEHLDKVKKEKAAEISKQLEEEKTLNVAQQLDIVCDNLAKKYSYVDKEEILTAMAYNPRFKGKFPNEIAKAIHEERAKKFGAPRSSGTQPSHPRTATSATGGKSSDDSDELFTPDAQGIRNLFKIKSK